MVWKVLVWVGYGSVWVTNMGRCGCVLQCLTYSSRESIAVRYEEVGLEYTVR